IPRPPRSTLFPYTTLFRSEIPLTNRSNFIPMTIDSIWIDDTGLPNPNATVFSWRSKLTGKTSGSYKIPPLTEDTLVIRGGILYRSEEHTSELQSQSNLVCR